MTKNKSFISIFVALLVLGLGLTIARVYQKQTLTPPVLSVEPPSPVPSFAPTQINEQISPDGSSMLALRVSAGSTEVLVNKTMVTRMVTPVGSELSIPFNTWSPDDKYFFLIEKKGTDDEYLVMNAAGKPFATGAQSLAIAELFLQAHPESTITDVTGWAAPTLIVVNAKSEAEPNISFWFDVQSRKFIRLSSYFN